MGRSVASVPILPARGQASGEAGYRGAMSVDPEFVPVAWIAGPDDAVARERARGLGVPVLAVEDLGGLRRARAGVVHVRLPIEDLGRAAWVATLARARAVVVTPLGEPAPLPWWERRFARYVLPSQRLARRWTAAGVALGRVVVVEPGADPGRSAPGPGVEAGVYEADEHDADDPTALVSAAAQGRAVRSTVPHEVLPPGAMVAGPLPAERIEALGAEARAWVARGRTRADELEALRVVYAEVAAMGTRPGLAAVLRGVARRAPGRVGS